MITKGQHVVRNALFQMDSPKTHPLRHTILKAAVFVASTVMIAQVGDRFELPEMLP